MAENTTPQAAVNLPANELEKLKQRLDQEYDVEPVQPTPEEPAAPAPSAAPPPPPSKPKHSADTLRRAQLHGIVGDLEAMSPDEASRALYLLDRKHDEYLAYLRQQQAPVAPQTVPPPSEDDDDFTKAMRELGLKEEVYDEGLLKALKKAHKKRENPELKALQERLERTEQELAQRRQQDQIREAEEFGKQVDSLFNANEALFGKGNTLRMAQGEHKQARIEVINMMDSIQRTYVQMGKEPPDVETLHARAIAVLYGAQQPPAPQAPPAPPQRTPEQEAIEKRKEQWNAGGIAPPAARSDKEVTGKKAALHAVADKLRANGVHVPTSDDDEEEGLPD